MFENLKLDIHDCSGIKYICLKYYLQILEEFHKKLSELQQCEYELENNGRKWQWAGHVQKTINKYHPEPFSETEIKEIITE